MNKRLEAIKNLVEPNCIVADIGTDHAYIPCALIKENRAKKCYACDVIEGPLTYATKNIESNNLSSQIEVILSNGLEKVPFDTEIVIIAGMGFNTAKEILEDAMDRLYKLKHIIVQVNKDVVELREWISNHHFTIEDEVIVYDQRYYQIIAFNTHYHESYSDGHIVLGPCLMHERNQLFLEYSAEQLETYKMITSVLSVDDQRYAKLSTKIQILESILYKSQ